MHLLLKRRRMRRSAFEVDVDAVRFGPDRNDFGAEFPKGGGRDLVGGTVCAVDGDPETFQRDVARQRPLGLLDITVDVTVDALGPADILRLGELPGHVLLQQVLDLCSMSSESL